MPRRKLDPLPSAAFHILLALDDGEKHGYGIMRQVAEDTEDKVRLGPVSGAVLAGLPAALTKREYPVPMKLLAVGPLVILIVRWWS